MLLGIAYLPSMAAPCLILRADCVGMPMSWGWGSVQETRLTVAPPGCASLDPERGPLARLPDDRDRLFAQVRSQGLRAWLAYFEGAGGWLICTCPCSEAWGGHKTTCHGILSNDG